MPATALFQVEMSQADAFAYTRSALRAAGAAPGAETPPSLIGFSITRRDLQMGGSLDAVMPGHAAVTAAGEGQATVTLAVEPASQFVMYALGIGLVALVLGGMLFGGMGGLWFLLVIGGEAYLFWTIFNIWPNEALAAIRARMQASPAVSGGGPVPQAAAPVYAPGPTPAAAAATASHAADIAAQIRHLAELRDQGHITQEEFDAKKTELLKRI
jgi:hypothetical protein